MKPFAFPFAVFIALALPAHAWEIEEIGTIEIVFADEVIEKPTVIVTNGDEVSPTAFMLLTVGNFSNLSLMSGDANFVIDATFMSHTPGPDTVAVSASVTYSPDGNMQFWLSEGAPEALDLTFTMLTIDGDEGHAVGNFSGLLCFADGLGAEADPGNCRPVEGRFDTPFFIER